MRLMVTCGFNQVEKMEKKNKKKQEIIHNLAISENCNEGLLGSFSAFTAF